MEEKKQRRKRRCFLSAFSVRITNLTDDFLCSCVSPEKNIPDLICKPIESPSSTLLFQPPPLTAVLSVFFPFLPSEQVCLFAETYLAARPIFFFTDD